MLSDIFSSFDDHNQVYMSYVFMWFISFLVIVVSSSLYWAQMPNWNLIIFRVKETIASQVFRSFGVNLGGFMNIVVSLFVCLIFSNLLGLVPYVFSVSSHLTMSLSLALPLWFSLIISATFFKSSYVVAALLPMGAPALLNPFLVIIETVSIMVRPITLSVRLMANMSAGHIVLTLVGNYLSTAIFGAWFPFIFLVSVQIFYTVFEVAICFIQAYIFCLLGTLYSDEHPHHWLYIYTVL
uniref:ATP synthase subunit a n=1 Tax=Obscurella hidalgoi TaxID=1663726 RepID=A0A0M3WPZ5_OBSHI|nr:ATP synthase F0 subunit 6 [Obscurella hidalgoi]AKL90679.1 ATP synthase F0 subunit 6 [Obscurella hidalgoi]